MNLVESVELVATADGETQLRRSWSPPEPRAAVLLVHGISEHSGRYQRVARSLGQRGLDVVSFDNRGHGQSGGPRGYVERFDVFLDDVEHELEQQRASGLPVVLFGHSLGGLIATSYVVTGRPPPDLLVLSAPALGAVVPRWQRVAAPVLSRMAPGFRVPNDLDGDLLSRDPEVQRAYEEDPLRLRRMSARLGNEVFTTMRATSAALRQLNLPTYVVHGADDQLVPVAVSRPLEALPNVTYRIWPGLRHETLNEPEGGEVLEEIATWIDAQLADGTAPALTTDRRPDPADPGDPDGSGAAGSAGR